MTRIAFVGRCSQGTVRNCARRGSGAKNRGVMLVCMCLEDPRPHQAPSLCAGVTRPGAVAGREWTIGAWGATRLYRVKNGACPGSASA